MVAAGQGGIHANGRQTYGHSMIVDAWGQTVAEQMTGTGWIRGTLDTQQQTKIRASMPVRQHNRFNSEFDHEFSGK
jgi:predicted amidohydrolase